MPCLSLSFLSCVCVSCTEGNYFNFMFYINFNFRQRSHNCITNLPNTYARMGWKRKEIFKFTERDEPNIGKSNRTQTHKTFAIECIKLANSDERKSKYFCHLRLRHSLFVPFITPVLDCVHPFGLMLIVICLSEIKKITKARFNFIRKYSFVCIPQSKAHIKEFIHLRKREKNRR